MPGVDSAAGTLAVPIWLAGAGAAVLVVAVLLAVKRAGGVALISSLFRVGLIAAVVLGAWLYVQQRGNPGKDSNAQSERRVLDDRKTALMTGAIAPGSALSCLDEMAGEAVETACEKAVFASPEAVASAVKYVSAQLTLLNDGTAYAERDPGYAAELAPLRTAIELDRFGLVAHVLGEREDCTPDRCAAATRLHDSTRVLANLRDGTFDEQVKKYTAIWNAPHPADGVVAAVGPPVTLPGATGPGTVAPRYDFPTSKSIPPVSIMAPEGPPPKEPPPPAVPPRDVMPQLPPPGQATPQPAAAEPATQSAAVTPTAPPPAAPPSITPVPPRRPPQVRVAPPPRSAPPPPPAAAVDLPPLDTQGRPPPPFAQPAVR
jgi:hypothetical protein